MECNSNHFKAYFNRGFAYDKIGQIDKAIHDYTKALQIDPYNAYCYYNRGISYDKKGESEEGVKNFTKAIEIDGTKADFYSNRGFSFRKLKKYKEAIDDYSEAISLNPSICALNQITSVPIITEHYVTRKLVICKRNK